MGKRPFRFTTQEIAIFMWCIGLFIIMITFFMSAIPGGFAIPDYMLLFIIVGFIFLFIGSALPNYQISKWDLNPLIDKLEPGFEVWLRFTKNRKFAPQIIKTGPLGQEKGLVSGHKADIINRGDFPITLRNGNHAVIKYDLMSHNINLNEAVGWEIINRKWGFLGSNAYRRCLLDKETVIKEEKKEDKKDEKK